MAYLKNNGQKTKSLWVLSNKNWDDQFGDRFQKLIFIGKPDILDDIQTGLEKCLFTQEELSKGSKYIEQLSDPFGNWSQMLQEQQNEELV